LEHTFSYIESHRVAPKSKPLSNYEKIVLNRIKACKRDYVTYQIKVLFKHYNIISWYPTSECVTDQKVGKQWFNTTYWKFCRVGLFFFGPPCIYLSSTIGFSRCAEDSTVQQMISAKIATVLLSNVWNWHQLQLTEVRTPTTGLVTAFDP